MHGHAFAESRDLFRERSLRLGAQPVDPLAQDVLSRAVKPRNLLAGELVRRLHRREAGPVKDLVRIRVADAAEEARIGQRALERVVLAGEP